MARTGKMSSWLITTVFLGSFVLSALSSCAITYPRYMTDQLVRQRIFKECMDAVDTGDAAAVQACDETAGNQAQVCVEDCPYPDYVSPEETED